VATTNDLKNGMTPNLDGQLWNVVDFQHVKPGKGGALVRTKLKNILSAKVVGRTGGTKPATLETGVRIQVPLFITPGEKIKVDTRTGDYLGRA
jgi:elongation factor P